MSRIASPKVAVALHRAAAQATKAPSVHNTQPWRLVVRDDGLDVRADRTRQLMVADASGRELVLSCGAALFNARVSLAADGVAVSVSAPAQGSAPDLLAEARVSPGARVPAEIGVLDTAIDVRRTARGTFEDVAVPLDVVGDLESAARVEGAVLVPLTPLQRVAVASWTRSADVTQRSSDGYREEVRDWVTRDGDRRDGVDVSGPPPRVRSADPMPFRDFRLDGSAPPNHVGGAVDGTILMLCSEFDTPADWMAGGAALQRVLLELTSRGLVAGIATSPVEVDAARYGLQAELLEPLRPLVLLRVGRGCAGSAEPAAPLVRGGLRGPLTIPCLAPDRLSGRRTRVATHPVPRPTTPWRRRPPAGDLDRGPRADPGLQVSESSPVVR